MNLQHIYDWKNPSYFLPGPKGFFVNPKIYNKGDQFIPFAQEVNKSSIINKKTVRFSHK